MLGSRPTPHTESSVSTGAQVSWDDEIDYVDDSEVHLEENDENQDDATADTSVQADMDDQDYKNLILSDLYNSLDESDMSEEVKTMLEYWADAPLDEALVDMKAFYDLDLQDVFAERSRQLREMTAQRNVTMSRLARLQYRADFASLLAENAFYDLMARAENEDPASILKMMDHIAIRDARIQQILGQQIWNMENVLNVQDQLVNQWSYEANRLSHLCDLQSYLHLAMLKNGITLTYDDVTADNEASNEDEQNDEVEAESNHETTDEVEAESNHEAADEVEQDHDEVEHSASDEEDSRIGLNAMTLPERSEAPAPVAVNSHNFWKARAQRAAALAAEQDVRLPVTPLQRQRS